MQELNIENTIEVMRETVTFYLGRAKQNPLKAQAELGKARGVMWALGSLMLAFGEDKQRIVINQELNDLLYATVSLLSKSIY